MGHECARYRYCSRYEPPSVAAYAWRFLDSPHCVMLALPSDKRVGSITRGTLDHYTEQCFRSSNPLLAH